MPVNLLLLRSLLQLYSYYGDSFRVEYPTGSGNFKNLYEVTQCISERIVSIFLKDESGRRPVMVMPKNSRPIPTGATSSCSMNISTAIIAGG
jgi:hypothetical protein